MDMLVLHLFRKAAAAVVNLLRVLCTLHPVHLICNTSEWLPPESAIAVPAAAPIPMAPPPVYHQPAVAPLPPPVFTPVQPVPVQTVVITQAQPARARNGGGRAMATGLIVGAAIGSRAARRRR